MIEVNCLDKILEIFFSLKAFGLLPNTFKMRALFFKITVSVSVGYFFFPSKTQNPNKCMVNKPLSEIPVYVTGLAAHSSCGVGRSRYGIQFHGQAFSCLSHDNALFIPAMLSAPVRASLLKSAAREADGNCSVPHEPHSLWSALSCSHGVTPAGAEHHSLSHFLTSRLGERTERVKVKQLVGREKDSFI